MHSIAKNLLIVSKFCQRNNVFFEFHSNSCFVRDKDTYKISIQGKCSKGLYQFNLDMRGGVKTGSSNSKLCTCSSLPKQVFTCNVNSSCDTNKPLDVNITYIVDRSEHDVETKFNNDLLWHRRLSHPIYKVVKIVIHQSYLLSLDKMSSIPIVCEVCQLSKSHKLPFIVSSNKARAPLMVTYIDVWGPSPLVSRNGFGGM